MTTLDDPLVITGGPFGVGVDIARVFSKHMGSFPSSKAAALWDKLLPARRTVPSASRTLAVLATAGDVTPCERQRWLANQMPSGAGNARAVRLFGTQLLSIRIELDD
jgi:hypothetical protein